jgi:glycine hydroxymethyltransferase
MLVDLRPKKVTGQVAEVALGKAAITVNKNMIPNDPEKPMVTSGIRVGTPALSSRGMGAAEMAEIAGLIGEVLERPEDDASLGRIRQRVFALAKRFPLYGLP